MTHLAFLITMLQHILLRLINLEGAAIEIHGALSSIILFAAYLPLIKPLLDTDFKAILDAHRCIIVVGDLNCKYRIWNSSWTTPNGKYLLRITQSHQVIVIGPVEPTFY